MIKAITLTTALLMLNIGHAVAQAGNLDLDFNGTGSVIAQIGTDARGFAIQEQADGRIVVAGKAANTSGTYDLVLLRYMPDGSVDNSFGSLGRTLVPISAGSTGTDNDNLGLAIQPDGRIVVATDGNGDFAVIRCNTDGTLDPSFSGDGVATTSFSTGADRATSVALQPDGRIVAAGFVGNANQDFAVARYNSDGSLDNTFSFDGKVTTAVNPTYDDKANAVAIAGDGSIVVAGQTLLTGGELAVVVKYNADGTLASGFGTNGIEQFDMGTEGFALAKSMVLLSDGRIVLGGTIYSSGDVHAAVTRLNANGSIDPSFGGTGTNVCGGAPTYGDGITLQVDGKVLLSGTANGDILLVRLGTDGTNDFSFGSAGTVITDIALSGMGDYGSAVTVQADGKILVTGQTQINDVGFNYGIPVVRYLSGLNIGIHEIKGEALQPRIWPNPATDHLTLSLPASTAGALSCTVNDLQGRVLARPVTNLHFANGAGNVDIPLDGLVPGLMVLRLSVGARTYELPFEKR